MLTLIIYQTSPFVKEMILLVWKEIPGYDGRYLVSEAGEVLSLAYGKQRLLRQRRSVKGYMQVNLCRSGKMKTFRVHQLVALCFELPGNGCEINHKNENKVDNRAENLEWCNRRYNVNYGSRIERQKKAVSKPVAQVLKNGITVIAVYPSEIQAGRTLGVNSSNIAACCLGKRKTAGGFRWRWANE